MKILHAPVALLLLLSVTSCDKAARLRQERADIEARILQGHRDLQDIDAKIAVFGQDADLAEISLHQERQQSATRAMLLESEISMFTSQCAKAETAFSQIRPLLDAYRAQNSR